LNDFPDVLGMELHDATALLEAEGLAFIVVETKPAKKELTEGALRVIKAQPQEKGFVLTVCRI
jgi:beta-lactam-binding protein with PASTA domain